MGATTTPTTFTDLYTDLLNRMRITLGTTAASTTNTNYARRYINQALHDLHIQQNWPWAERRDVILTHDEYTVGKLSIASTSRTTLEGNNTLWNTAVSGMGFNNIRAGGKVLVGGETEVYTITSVASDTSATLVTRYVGGQTTATAYAVAHSGYTYFEDEYALASDFFRLVDTRMFSDEMDIPIISSMEFNRRYPRNSQRGKPKVATIIELGPSASVALRPRVLFHPAPDAVYQIPYRYITGNLAVATDGTAAANLSADTDEPIVPLRYRHVLVAYAAWQWYRDLKDDQRAQEAEAAYSDLVRRLANDSTPQRDHPIIRVRRMRWLGGVAGPIRGVSRRGAGGASFDELRE